MLLKSNKSKLIFALYALNVWLNAAYAEHVLPVFSGYWINHPNSVEQDACGANIYTYEYRALSSPEEFASKIFSDIHTQTFCKWGNMQLIKAPNITPTDYPSQDGKFRDSDWNKTQSTPGASVTMTAIIYCFDNKGNKVGFDVALIEPSYVCPPGSTPGQWCETNAICSADILARDLGFPGVGFFGHVGLASIINTHVIEVLKQSKTIPYDGIYENPIESIKNDADNPFWGEKFGLPEKKTLHL